jgi:papilin
MCHQFTYSGCDGNSNNFESELECRNMCNAKEISNLNLDNKKLKYYLHKIEKKTLDPCILPLDHGTCDNYKIFWYFDQVDRECVRFYYGGFFNIDLLFD